MASLIAAATAYATWGEPMIPFFVFYSMFGFHRLGDLIWALGDMRGRGFLLAATAGRTTLQGEGLQHCDGHSHASAAVVPNCRAYDPAFAYEVAVIIRDGLRRMYGPDPEDVFYYVTLYNETYPMPAMPDGAEEGIVRGLYRCRPAAAERTHRVQLLASGTAMLAALEAQRLLADDHDVAADVWSATSYQQLRDDALAVERWNRLHPTEPPRRPYVAEAFDEVEGPVVAVTDFVKAVPDQIARWVPQPFVPLGTDGFGLSDARAPLRRHFEVDAAHVVGGCLARTGPARRRQGRGRRRRHRPLRHRRRGARPDERVTCSGHDYPYLAGSFGALDHRVVGVVGHGTFEAARKMGRAVGVLVLGGVDEDERRRRQLDGTERDEDGGPDGDRVSRDEQRRREPDGEGEPAETS